jgi:hypothetical protein
MKLRIALLLMIVMLVMIVPVYAQEATAEPTTTSAEVQEAQPESHPIAGVAEAENESVPYLTPLVLLIGLGAIAVVGFGSWVRANSRTSEA